MGDTAESAITRAARRRGSSARRRVVIVGGGFGGIAAAQALARADVDITLIDRANHHLFQPLLYQVAMAGLSPADIAAPIRGVLSAQSNVRVLLAEVTDFDLAAKRVMTTAGDLPFDALVVAAGARNHYFGHDDWAARAPGLKTLDDALSIRRRVLLAFERAEQRHLLEGSEAAAAELTFVVIGGGPTGVELAGSVAELARFALASDFRAIRADKARVVLVEGGPSVLAAFPPSLTEAGARQLAELGVELRLGARVSAIDEAGVVIRDAAGAETRIDAAVVLWGAGVRASPLAEKLVAAAHEAPSPGDGREAPNKVDGQGRVPVDECCALPGHPDVYVVGDMAAFHQDGKPLPGLSPVAMQQGRYVARRIKDQVAGSEGKPFRYVDKGTMATIGRSRAVAWSGPLKVTGFLAWLMWLFVHLWFLITFRNRVAVLLTWAWSYFTYKRGARLITEHV